MRHRRAVFLDRDGTLCEEVGHLHQLQDLSFFPEAFQCVRLLRRAGFLVIVVTNQSAVARGLLSEARLRHIHRRMLDRFQQRGAFLDGLYYCPHHPEEGEAPYRTPCGCRKPQPGMLLQAAADFHLDLRRSYLVGDSASDIQAARRAGCRSILVLTGHGGASRRALQSGEPSHTLPEHIAADLPQAVDWILEQDS